MQEKLYKELKEILKKLEMAPPTGHGLVKIGYDVDINFQFGEIVMVEVLTKNKPEKK